MQSNPKDETKSCIGLLLNEDQTTKLKKVSKHCGKSVLEVFEYFLDTQLVFIESMEEND